MPTRLLYPALLSSRKYNGVSPEARDLYVRLLVLVDDFGRYVADPVMLARAAYPINEDITSKKVAPLLDDIAKVRLVLLYEVNGERYLEVTNWNQRTRAMASKFPDPPDASLLVDGHVPVMSQADNGHPRTETYTESETYISSSGDSDQLNMPSLNIGEIESATSSSEAITPSRVVELYNAFCTALPKANALTNCRRKKLVLRIREHPDIMWWRDLFAKVQETPFLTGNSDRGWRADLDWLIANDTNAMKVLEGKYDCSGKRPSSKIEVYYEPF